MTGEKHTSPKAAARAEREKRLAVALRANLKKRKAAAKSDAKADKHDPPARQGPAGDLESASFLG